MPTKTPLVVAIETRAALRKERKTANAKRVKQIDEEIKGLTKLINRMSE